MRQSKNLDYVGFKHFKYHFLNSFLKTTTWDFNGPRRGVQLKVIQSSSVFKYLNIKEGMNTFLLDCVDDEPTQWFTDLNEIYHLKNTVPLLL